jgi:hypothetical protein
VLELMSLIVACFAFASAKGADIAALTSDGDESGSPLQMQLVLLCVLQWGFIVADHSINLRQHVGAKLLLLWCSILVYVPIIFHLWEPLSDAPLPLGLWFLLKVTYYYLVGREVRHGFGRHAANFRVSNITKNESRLHHYTFLVFENLPFFAELCTAMEWVWNETTLELVDAIKLNRMFAVTYLARCRWQRLLDTGRHLGRPQKMTLKIATGVLLMIIATLLIWGPFLLITGIAGFVNYSPNNVDVASAHVDLVFEEGTTVTATDSFSIRLFETTYHSLVTLGADAEQLLSDSEFVPFLQQYRLPIWSPLVRQKRYWIVCALPPVYC